MTDWDEIYSHLIASFCWTWEYIDNYVTIPQLAAITKYQSNHIPVQTMIQGYLGIDTTKKEVIEEKQSFNEFMQNFQGSF